MILYRQGYLTGKNSYENKIISMLSTMRYILTNWNNTFNTRHHV